MAQNEINEKLDIEISKINNSIPQEKSKKKKKKKQKKSKSKDK